MKTFHIDPEFARRLAADLNDAANIAQPAPPVSLESPSEEFLNALCAALEAVQARNDQLIKDSQHLAETGLATANAAQRHDESVAEQLDSMLDTQTYLESFGAVI